MPRELFNRGIDLDLLYPPFLERLLILKDLCTKRGSRYLCTFGFRTVEESDEMYKRFLAGGPRAAPGGYSSHNFGLASDEALIIKESPNRVVTWGSKDKPAFNVLGEEAQKLGLHWGKNYSDEPHISWPGFVNGKELAPLRAIWALNQGLPTLQRLQQVWSYVDEHSALSPVHP